MHPFELVIDLLLSFYGTQRFWFWVCVAFITVGRICAALIFAGVSPAFGQEQNPLIGTWKLVSQQSIVEGMPPENVFGEKPNGYLIVTREGRVMALFTAEKRQSGMGDAERAALHKSMAAISGKYRVEENTFVIAVDASWNEAWNGTDLVRHFK